MKITWQQSIRLFLMVLPVIMLSCHSGSRSGKTNGYLNYGSASKDSGAVSAELHLSGNIKKQELSAEIKLINQGQKAISIREITVIAPGGLRSFPATGNIQPVKLQQGKDTLINVKFNPVNDANIYALTGKQGHFKQEYKISVSFQAEGEEKMSAIDLNVMLPEDDYKAYISKYGAPVTGYSFNTDTDFGQIEGDYLETLKLHDQPFAFVAQHELALTGLNIWLTSFCEQDSLYAELLIVSHADFAVKIIPDSIDFTDKDQGPSGRTKTVALEKITGSKQAPAVMENCDKVLIHLKRPLKNPQKQMAISIKNSFMVNGSKPLFNDDIELKKVSLP